MTETLAPDGKPMVGPFDRAGWRRWLIENLTFVALRGVETSRAGVREWQTNMFGQSLASSLLKQYGKAERSGGGRVGKIQLTEDTVREGKAFYKAYAEKIKVG